MLSVCPLPSFAAVGSQCRRGAPPPVQPGGGLRSEMQAVRQKGVGGVSHNAADRHGGGVATWLILAVGVGVAQAVLTVVLLPQIKPGTELEDIAV